jgi:hypothetical protein
MVGWFVNRHQEKFADTSGHPAMGSECSGAMADSFPIPTRSGVAREPLDPTAVTPGPQPVDVSERDGHHVIVGEVLKPGRHRAFRPRRKVAISGAVLSAAGAFVTLALMMGHGGSTVSAAPRVTPSAPLPDLPDEPAAAQHPAHTAPTPPAHTAAPVAAHTPTTPHTVAPPVTRAPAATAQQRLAAAAAQMRAQIRQDSAHDAQVWAAAMREAAAQQHGGRQQAAARAYERQAAEQSQAANAGAGRSHGPRHAGGGYGGHGRGGR